MSPSDAQLEEIKRNYVTALLEDERLSGPQPKCWKRYLTYLHSRIRLICAAIILPVAVGLEPSTELDSAAARIITYKMLFGVQCYLRDTRQSALLDLVVSLKDKNLIKDGSEPLALQMGFLFVGRLTALFDPLPDATSRTFVNSTKGRKVAPAANILSSYHTKHSC